MKKKQTFSLFKRCFSLFIAFCCFSALVAPVSGHEIYYSGSEPYPLRWSIMSGGKVNWKVYNLGLSSFYSKHFNTVAYTWKNACPNQITASITKDYGTANICILQPSKSSWDNRFKNYPNLAGYCESLSTDGIFLNSLEDVKKSSQKIKYAKIHLIPYTEKISNDTEAKAVMVHELGHALGLGHAPDIEPSIMRSPPYLPNQGRTSWLPQSHDKTDVANFY